MIQMAQRKHTWKTDIDLWNNHCMQSLKVAKLKPIRSTENIVVLYVKAGVNLLESQN